jgi:hypothetical protein
MLKNSTIVFSAAGTTRAPQGSAVPDAARVINCSDWYFSPENLTDSEYDRLLKTCGHNSNVWRWRVIGLLPGAQRRGLHKRNKCHSIYEYARKLCGLSEALTDLAITLEKKLQNLPHLRRLFIFGEVSIHKLRKIAVIATPENEANLAFMVKMMSKNAVEAYVRDEKYELAGGGAGAETGCAGAGGPGAAAGGCAAAGAEVGNVGAEVGSGAAASGGAGADMLAGGTNNFCELTEIENEFQSCPGTTGLANCGQENEANVKFTGPPACLITGSVSVKNCSTQNLLKRLEKLGLDERVLKKLEELKSKGLDVNKVLLELLQSREEGIRAEKARIKIELDGQYRAARAGGADASDGGAGGDETGGSHGAAIGAAPISRHIQEKVKRVLRMEYGDRCGVSGCGRRATQWHHKIRFSPGRAESGRAESGRADGLRATHPHSPYNLIPVCAGHHALEHYIDDDAREFIAPAP